MRTLVQWLTCATELGRSGVQVLPELIYFSSVGRTLPHRLAPGRLIRPPTISRGRLIRSTHSLVALHAYIIIGAGDIPAMSMLMRIKGHNAYCPCRMCRILGVQIPDSATKVYYIPLDRSRHPSVAADPTRPQRYDPLNLPLRSHSEFLRQAREVDECCAVAAEDRLAKAYGVKGTPLLQLFAFR